MPRRQPIDSTPLHHKLGYQHHVERDHIREHLIRRGHDPKAFEFEFRITRIQERIAKYKPTLKWRQEVSRLTNPPKPSWEFTKEELKFLMEHFQGANDPTAQSIFNKTKYHLTKNIA